MENIYSTKSYCEISEVPGVELYEDNIDIDDRNSIVVYGLSTSDHLTLGLYAPFWMSERIGSLSLRQLEKLSFDLLEKATARRYKEITIKLPPSTYTANIDLFKFQLLRVGFKSQNLALWQSIECYKHPSASSYEASLKHSARKVLKRFSENYSFEFRIINPIEQGEIDRIYLILEENRRRLGVRLKYSLEYLKRLISVARGRIEIFEINVIGVSAAVALCHRVKEDVLYVAAWGDVKSNIAYSPMYKFSSELVGYCIANGIRRLDFGVSSDLENYTPNLFEFKSNIGCEYTLQETLFFSNYSCAEPGKK